ncbi:50S ribosomal protein L9 [Iodidimonas gelatinilytica]|uniref:Large ribosomal subunit protein bL9 n=1 Tax=Iodidimonas gelatinilytica TaxID=1236966 RepID=A0A5A7N1S7_9PROT|nr:50S ribosomal protein L9 [Iodidimonas gelatinilytica]GEQ96892.1 50S ribosomal protein L9 [Iodidimonas gelatinilytica]GER01109.1 50S ribosomal protein L9 [Iodidimonas gelatinilytica]
MKVILLERVPNLGQMGDEVNVKPGFARNFLLPRSKALRATVANRKAFEARRKDIEAQNLARREEAESVAGKMTGARFVLVRQAGESGQLYGSVTARDVADALGEQGFQIVRSQVELQKPIKELGLHTVLVRLHPEVSVDVTANVARSETEAEQQWKIGGAILGDDADDLEDEADMDTEQLVQDLLEDEDADDADMSSESEDEDNA